MTPSVKTKKALPDGFFENLPAVCIPDSDPDKFACHCDHVDHSAGHAHLLCVTVEKESNIFHICRLFSIALHDLHQESMRIEMVTPGLDLYDVCRGSFQELLLADIQVLIEPHGFEHFSPFVEDYTTLLDCSQSQILSPALPTFICASMEDLCDLSEQLGKNQ